MEGRAAKFGCRILWNVTQLPSGAKTSNDIGADPTQPKRIRHTLSLVKSIASATPPLVNLDSVPPTRVSSENEALAVNVSDAPLRMVTPKELASLLIKNPLLSSYNPIL